MNKNFFNISIKNIVAIFPLFFLIYLGMVSIIAVSDYYLEKKKPKYESKFIVQPLSSYHPDFFQIDKLYYDAYFTQNFYKKIYQSNISKSDLKDCLPNKQFFGTINQDKNSYNFFLETYYAITNECIKNLKEVILYLAKDFINETIKNKEYALKFIEAKTKKNNRCFDQIVTKQNKKITGQNKNSVGDIETIIENSKICREDSPVLSGGSLSLLLGTDITSYRFPELTVLSLNKKKTFYSFKKNLILPLIFSILLSLLFFKPKKR